MFAKPRLMVRAIVCAVGVLPFQSGAAAEEKSEFARGTIDLGVVVSQIDPSVKFYTEAIGFKELPGFTVAADFCADAGLTNHLALTIRVLSLGDEPSAT